VATKHIEQNKGEKRQKGVRTDFGVYDASGGYPPRTPGKIGAVRKQMDSPVCQKRCFRPHPATNDHPEEYAVGHGKALTKTRQPTVRQQKMGTITYQKQQNKSLTL
jgi:hypothetical protein